MGSTGSISGQVKTKLVNAAFILIITQLAGNYMDVNEHNRLLNLTLRHKSKGAFVIVIVLVVGFTTTYAIGVYHH